MYTVFGAGSVGTVLAALLADAKVPVALCGRGAIERLRAEGDEETVIARVPVITEPEGTILLCVHEPDVAPLAAGWAGRAVVTFQNGVLSEEVAARHCRVIGAVWRMTCTLVEPGVARFTHRGSVALGRHPRGVDSEVRALAADLARAGFRADLRECIGAAKWLKLLVNLTSAPNALVRPSDHGDPRFAALKVSLMEEALPLLLPKGVDPEEARAVIDRVAGGSGGRSRPVFNATWRRLSRGLPPKERYHDTVVALGPAPRNAALLAALERATEPGTLPLSELLAALS